MHRSGICKETSSNHLSADEQFRSRAFKASSAWRCHSPFCNRRDSEKPRKEGTAPCTAQFLLPLFS
jgi:hypothetical protein